LATGIEHHLRYVACLAFQFSLIKLFIKSTVKYNHNF